MTTLREAAHLALEALETDTVPINAINNAAAFLRAALEQPEEKPVAWMMINKTHNLGPSLHWKPQVDWHITWEAVPLYTHPHRLTDEVRMLQEQNAELDKKLADYEQTSLELCEQCGWRFMIPGEGCLKCNAGPYKLSCGCKSKWLGLPAFWGTSTREGEGENAVAHGVVCERHWHEWGCWSPEMDDLNIIKRTLTDEVIADLWYQNGTYHHHFARAIEAWLNGKEYDKR